MGTDIEIIISRDSDKWPKSLENFIKNEAKSFAFPELTQGTKRNDIWKSLCEITKSSEDAETLRNCFSAIRILSRDKMCLGELVTDDWMTLLKEHCGYDDNKFIFNSDTTLVCIEAQKSLCNIMFNCRMVARKCCDVDILEAISERIRRYTCDDIPKEVKFFDVKLMFLITALVSEVRGQAKQEHDSLVLILEEELKHAAENHLKHEELPPIFLNDEQVDIVCEVLKALFNITVQCDESDAEVVAKCFTLVEILRNYLLISSSKLEKTWMLRNNVVNLLTNMPNEAYISLLTPVDESHRIPKNLEFEGSNMTAIYEILMFLKAKFNDDPKISHQHEVLSPVVTVLLKGAACNRKIRKFLRHHILPPLKDVHTRPEQGTTLRNHFCRLLTTPITQLRDLIAELLFVLCKKNVSRMIKYTGYGNAAGLFAQRGLLAGGHDKGEDEYSSDSADSDTEEYADHKHGINPVIGCYEEPHVSVLQNMSAEQKEYEAMKLVELMDSLMKCGTIKPCRVGKDGKPEAIEHILQLQEGLQDDQIRNGG